MAFEPLVVTITEKMREDAIQRHLFYGESFKNHEIEGGKGRIWGSLGEVVVASVLEGCTEALNFNFDLVWRGKTWDIKTKTRKDIPNGDWDASIAASAMHQKTDFYIFVSIVAEQNLLNKEEDYVLHYPYKLAYIVGCISKDDYLRKSTMQIAGSTDPRNGIVYRMDTYTLPYKELIPLRKAIESPSKKDKGTESLIRANARSRPKVFQRFGS